MNVNRESPKFREARNSLPESLRPVYDQLVDDYAFATARFYGQGYVSYRVLASLVETGWRPPEVVAKR